MQFGGRKMDVTYFLVSQKLALSEADLLLMFLDRTLLKRSRSFKGQLKVKAIQI